MRSPHTTTKSSPRSLQLEKAHKQQQRRPSADADTHTHPPHPPHTHSKWGRTEREQALTLSFPFFILNILIGYCFATIPDSQIFLYLNNEKLIYPLKYRVSASLKLPDTHRVRVVQVADLTRHILCWWPCIHLACSRLFTWINYMTLSKELLQVSIKVPALFKQKGWEPSNSTLLELSKNLIFYRESQCSKLNQDHNLSCSEEISCMATNCSK